MARRRLLLRCQYTEGVVVVAPYDDEGIHFDLAIALKNLGKNELSKKHLQLAIAGFNKHIELNPDQSNLYLGLANALAMNGELDEAISVLQKGIDHIKGIGRNDDINLLLNYLGTLEDKNKQLLQD